VLNDVPVSVLETAMVRSGRPESEALAHTVTMAREAERLGFRRFWVAEHHGVVALASADPAVLIATLAAKTESIRVGSGGVMLPNHHPFMVAEQFGVLGAVGGGRVDLAVGKGTGTADPAVAEVLRRSAPSPSDKEYAEEVRRLLGYFTPGGSLDVRAVIAENYPPQVWMLGSSESSATLAAELGLPLAVANHIRPRNTESAVAAYRRHFKPSRWLDRPHVMVSVAVVSAESDERAEELARPFEVLVAQARAGQRSAVATPEEAATYPFTPEERQMIAVIREGEVRGDAARTRRDLAALIERFAPDELIVAVPVYDIEDRVRVLQAIAG
jgi:luciferase family oxidoreductase group 1